MKKYMALKIVSAAIYAVTMIVIALILFSVVIEKSVDGSSAAALALLFLIPLCCIIAIVPTGVALAGLILSIVMLVKKVTTKGTLIYFIVFTLLPYLTFYIIILILQIVL